MDAPPRPPSVMPLSGGPAPPAESNTEFRLSQCFGDCSPAEEVTDADILSAVQFDSSGEYLATGDRGGRVVIFKQNSPNKQKVSASGKVRRTSDFKFFTEFQSHEAEFDYLKSLEIEEKINQIKWCPRAGNALLLLSTNDKTVKLWKVRERRVKKVVDTGGAVEGGRPLSAGSWGAPGGSNGGISGGWKGARHLTLPRVDVQGSAVSAQPRSTFSNAHAYHINSIDPNSDGEHFLSADDLRVNLWNLGVTDKSFNVVDIKPKNMEELKEVITSAAFHPHRCNIFMYSSSRGSIKIGDMRMSAVCENYAQVLEETIEPGGKTFFSEIVASISDIKTTQCGRYIVSRDYMTLKLWDLNMGGKPVVTIPVHDHLRPQLCDLYENDCIFDKFECAVSGDAKSIVTGSYNNLCSMYNRYGDVQTHLEISKDPSRRSSAKKSKRRAGAPAPASGSPVPLAPPAGPIDFDKKILHMSWHPRDDIIAVAGLNKLYIYTAQQRC